MSFPSKIIPNHTPKGIAEQGSLMVLQDRILQYLLLGSFVLGALWFASTAPAALQQRDWRTLILSGILLVTIAVIAIMRHLTFQARAGLFLAVLYLLDVQLLLQTGFSALTLVFLTGMLFYAGLFFGWEMLVVTLGLSLAASLTRVFTPGSIDTIFSLPDPNTTGMFEFVVSIIAMLVVFGSALFEHVLIIDQYKKSLMNEHKVIQDLENERKNVETKLSDQTDYYQRRLEQWHVSGEIKQAISRVVDSDELLQTTADVILERFNFYYVGVFVLDATKRHAVLRAGTGEAGRRMLSDGHSLPVGGTSMIGWATLNKQARVALDVGSEAVRFNNPHLPYTRSEIALPIMLRGEVLGAMTIQSTQPNAFADEDMAILQGIANNLGIALDNARLLKQTEDTLEEVRMINRDYVSRTWTETARQHGNTSVSYEVPHAQSGAVQAREFPILLRDQVIGYVTLESDREELSEDDLAFIDAVTSQTGVALENARLLEETQRHAAEEQALNAMTEKFSQAVSVDDVLESALKELSELPSVAEVSIHLVSPGMTAGSNGHNGNGNGK